MAKTEKTPEEKTKETKERESTLGCFMFIVIAAVGCWYFFSSSDKKVSPDELLAKNPAIADINKLPTAEREELYAAYINKHQAQFHHAGSNWALLCLKDMAANKAENITLNQFGDWCIVNAKNPDKFHYWDRTVFDHNFSGWDGSYRPLVKIVKAAMDDPDSFEHVQTTFKIVNPTDKSPKPKAFVRMDFKGKNAFNATVSNSVLVEVDPLTGTVTKFIEQQ